MSTPDEVQVARDKAQLIMNRLQNEAGFKERVVADPAGTLAAAGLPPVAIGDFVRETNLTEVSGYAIKSGDCDGITCIISICNCSLCGTSGCGGSCHLSIP